MEPVQHYRKCVIEIQYWTILNGVSGYRYCGWSKCVFLEFRIFSAQFSRHTAGRRRHDHRLRWPPVGAPPLGDFFSNWSKLMIFYWKLSLFCDMYLRVFCSNFNKIFPKIIQIFQKKNMKKTILKFSKRRRRRRKKKKNSSRMSTQSRNTVT